MKKIGFKVAIIACLLQLFLMNAQAQASKPGSWKTYMAYQDATLVAETPNHVFAVYKGLYNDKKIHNDGSLLSYSTEDEEVATYSFEDGLNDVGITQMAYSPDTKSLILIYENSNIDLFYGKNNVVNISSIRDKTEYSNKTVNHIDIIGKYAYISTGFGIVIIDLDRKEIKNTCLLGNIIAVCQWGNDLYVSTEDGLKRTATSSMLQDPDNWKPFQLNYNGNGKKIEKMVIFKDYLVFYDSSNTNVYYLAKDGTIKLLLDDSCRQLAIVNEQLVICASNSIFFYTDLTKNPTKIDKVANDISSLKSNNVYWISQPGIGLTGIKKELNTNESSVITSGIKINSPLRNYCFDMIYSADKLLVVGGDRWSNRLYNEGTFMIYENGRWTNFDDKAIAKQTGLSCLDFISVAVDPRDSKHYFVGSWGEGVYEFRDTTFIKLHTHTNGALQSSLPNDKRPEIYVRVGGMAYDKNNNLYMVNYRVRRGLVIMDNSDNWHSVTYPSLTTAYLGQLIVTKNNQKWVNNFRMEVGIFVLADDNNTIDDPSDDTYYSSNRFVDQQGTDIKANQYLCLAEDLNGVVWAGTDNGPISFSSAEQVGEGTCNRIILTDQYNAGYYLLEGQRISAIAVDGANRKWIGTTGGGIFVVDNSGENVNVENFNTSNSYLISDNIVSIAINNKTGEVFIGTDRGLVSYMSNAIQGLPDYSNVYAFPNPVKPANNSQVIITGLMSDSNVKITDLAGNLIKQGISMGGQYTWNCTNRSGSIVKAGIYLVFAALPDGSQGVVTKIMVIK